MVKNVLPAGSEDPKDLPRLFKYYRQFANRALKCRQKFQNIQAMTDYKGRKSLFDRLSRIISKYGIDRERYVRYCALGIGCQSAEDMADVKYLKMYADHLTRVSQYGSIVHNFRRSAANLADMCIANGTTPAQEMAKLITENRLGYEYITGRISKYFIASIRNFRKIYWKLDAMNRDELRILYDVSEELCETAKQAFLEREKRTVAPLSLTDETIREKLKLQKQENQEVKSNEHILPRPPDVLEDGRDHQAADHDIPEALR